MCVDICGIPHIVSYLQPMLLRPPLSYQVKRFLAFCSAGRRRQVLRRFLRLWFGVLILNAAVVWGIDIECGCGKGYGVRVVRIKVVR